jgi:hypothetical protein
MPQNPKAFVLLASISAGTLGDHVPATAAGLNVSFTLFAPEGSSLNEFGGPWQGIGGNAFSTTAPDVITYAGNVEGIRSAVADVIRDYVHTDGSFGPLDSDIDLDVYFLDASGKY